MAVHWQCVVLVLAGHFFATMAAPPNFNVPTPTAELHNDVGVHMTYLLIGVTDPADFTCTTEHTAQSFPFSANLNVDTNGYILILSHSNPTALTLPSYTVQVKCTNVNDGLSGTIDVTVTVSGNSPPTADTNLIEIVPVDVSAKFPALTILHQVAATDPNGDAVTCTATSVSPDFFVDTNDCTIRSDKDLRSLSLALSEAIQIDVTDGVNSAVPFRRVLSFSNHNRAPEFTRPSGRIVTADEDVTSSDVLVTFDATDDQPFFRTFSVDKEAFRFDFDSATGKVTLAAGQSLDYEAGTLSFVMECVANDGFFPTTSTVILNVLNANDAPVISPLFTSVTLEEGEPSPTRFANLLFTVTDEDGPVTSASHTYSVVPGGAYSDFFHFPNPGQKVLANFKELDREGVNSPPSPLTVDIAVTDSGGLSATAQVVVSFTDVNDNEPVFVASSLVMKSSVYVGMPFGSVLGQVEATDADEGVNQDVLFSLATGSPDPSLFYVAPGGTVILAQDLTTVAYGTPLWLEVQATDQGSPPPPLSSTAIVTLEWNRPPVMTNLPARADVPEDPTVQKLLLTLTTSDPENDAVSCSVSDVTPNVQGSSSFVVRTIPGTSALGVYYSAAEDLSRTIATSYDVTVTAVDGKGGSSTAVLTVEVTPNTRPTSSCDGAASVNVDVLLPKNADVYIVTVNDVENDAIDFIWALVPDSGSFRFDPGFGKVYVNRDLRLEPESSHELVIHISDNHNAAITCTLYITITGKNYPPAFADHPPVIPVDEHVTALSSLFQFDVTDDEAFSMWCEVDPLGDTAYFVFDEANQQIQLDSGQSFDYETKPTQFRITCTADDGFQQSFSTVTISIYNSNDPPVFVNSAVTTTADEGPGGTVTFQPLYDVVDPDGDSLTYSIVAGGTYSDYFAINSNDGTLTNQVLLDRDNGLPDEVSIEVEVTDPSGNSATSVVLITLNDVNDNIPIFTQNSYEFKVGLSTQRGALLGTLEFSDIDDEPINHNVVLEITKQSPPGYMTLEQDGRLYLTRDLDVPYGTLFSLEVNVTDTGSPALSSTAVVEVVWNEGPKIQNLPDTVIVLENIEGRQSIFNLDVIDIESDQYTCVQDAIDPPTTLFSVVDTGNKDFKVFFSGAGSLASSDVSQYMLTVRCYDANGQMSLDLAIYVQPNTAPVLTCSPAETITVDAIQTLEDNTVHTLSVKDNLENDPLEFGLTSSIFYVSTVSGAIKAKDTLRFVTTDHLSLSITVYDGELTGDCTLNVILTNLNKAPRFPDPDDTVYVAENTAAGSVIHVFAVEDPNIFDPNIDITWSQDEPKFDVEVIGLTVTVKLAAGAELDYENPRDRTTTLTFEAFDGYLPSDVGVLRIRVTPVNEPPYFDKNIIKYSARVNEISDPAEIKSLGCRVLDPDDGDVVILTLSGAHAELFSIADQDNCQLKLIREYDLDPGAPDELTLTLTATDSDGETAEATVTVKVTPINDHFPVFANGAELRIVKYGMKEGDVIGAAVEAKDEDVGKDGVLSYDVEVPPSNTLVANQYITFTSTGQFRLVQSMDALQDAQNFKYIILAKDHGDVPKTATLTVNVVYDPFITTTPDANLTSTTEATQPEDETSIWEEPLVIGLLVALVCIAALLALLGLFLCCKYCSLCSSISCRCCCKSRPASPDSLYPSRPNSPLRSNKISVMTIDNEYPPTSMAPLVTGYEGRKVSSLMPPPAHY